MNSKTSRALFTSIAVLLLFAGSVYAAPTNGPVLETAVFFAEAVNLPGWLGGVLVLISIILPIGAFQWLKQK